MNDLNPSPLADLQSEALRLLETAHHQNITLRLFGGMAVRLRCPSTSLPGLKRSYVDLDFVTEWANLAQIEQFFHAAGYTADRTLNTLYGDRRQLYLDEGNHRQIDLLVDEFEMCHQIPLTRRLKIDAQTLPLAELLLTKMQIVEMNQKDVLDVCAILLDHELGSSDGEIINIQVIQSLAGDDWGLYTTVMDNLNLITEMIRQKKLNIPGPKADLLINRLDSLVQTVQVCPKTTRWKMRALVGKRMSWFEEVEEIRR